MNIKEAVKLIEQTGEYEHFVYEPISKKAVLNIVRQIDEPQQPVVPQLIADWIEEAKTTGYNIKGALVNAPKGIISDWLELYNVEVFAAAWVNGYTIEPEKEKRYRAKVKGMNSMNGYLARNKNLGTWYFGISGNDKNHCTNHTRKELEDAGFGWVFDCEGVEVKEVE